MKLVKFTYVDGTVSYDFISDNDLAWFKENEDYSSVEVNEDFPDITAAVTKMVEGMQDLRSLGINFTGDNDEFWEEVYCLANSLMK